MYNNRVLPNGLVMSHVRTKCPGMFRMEIIIRAGGLDETKEEIGFAHFIEHLMSFFPSNKYPDSLKNQKNINRKSIEVNAWTEPNTVGYYMEGLEEHRDLMIDYMMENYTDPILDPKVFEQERNAVISELSGMIGGADYYLSKVADYVKYKSTNLSYTIEYELNNVKKNATLDNIMSFRDRFYIPPMTNIIIASDTEGNSIMDFIQSKWFSVMDIPNEPLNYAGRIIKPTQANFGRTILYIPEYIPQQPEEEEEEQIEIDDITKVPDNGIFYIPCDMGNSSMVEFHFPLDFDYFDERVFYLDFIQTLLVGGLSSRLYYKLRSELGAVYGVDASFHADPRCKGLSTFCITTDTSIKKLPKVFECIIREIERLVSTKSILRSELDQFRNKINIKKRLKECSNSSGKWLKFYKPYLIWGITPPKIEDIYNLQMKISPKKLRTLCREIFNPDRLAVFYTCSEPVIQTQNNSPIHYTLDLNEN